MLKNPEIVKNSYICKKAVANYLVDLGFPLLGSNRGKYYFVKTFELEMVLNNLPLWLRILNKITS